jgi:hypothetical protein
MDPYLRGYRRAAKHLLAAGLLPAPCPDGLRFMWQAGPEDRAAVREISERWIWT